VLEVDTGGHAEPEGARVLGDDVDAEPLRDLIEEHVARLHQGFVQVDRAVPALLPAAKVVVPELQPTRTIDPVEWVDDSFFQGRRGHDDF